jgi:peptidoglycan/xylan/chitin deacetylase (PgdA/CDA1 family)
LPAARLLFPTITTVRAESHAIALTFDDGPDEGLEDFLRLLEEAGARTTFFVVGEQVERAPDRLREIVACGHEVAVHCYRHRNHLRLTPRQVTEDMQRARERIEEVSGGSTRLFRPPYGIFNLASWLEAGRQGWQRVLWTRWGKDWEQRATPYSIASEIGWPEAGDVLLLHDSDRYSAPGSWRNTLGALPVILEQLSARELQILPVGELLDRNGC